MIKVVVLLKRRAGLSHEEFMNYYEQQHVPLVRKLLPTIGRYTRSYLGGRESVSEHRQEGQKGSPTPYFDVITEVWFEDEAAYDHFVGALKDPQTSQRLGEDEAKFLDPSVIQTFRVEERIA